MARRSDDVDWYVEMSEALERRDRRRKWVILGITVAVPMLLMAMVAGAAIITQLDQEGRLPEWFKWPKFASASETDAVAQPDTFEPVSVESFQTGDIIYSQLDRNEFVTSISHFFRELRPDDNPNTPFTININRNDQYSGQIQLYRLRNVGTGEVFEFKNVGVKRLASGDWMITDDGQKQIRDQLQARMRVQIRRIGGG